jgi:phenylpropionate dioxygenase-like ring-hydroxylating dioxygenase large terminal subunit
MFMNFWYVAELSENVQETPVKVRMLGFDYVLFRDSAGQAHCLSNLCVHRGASLAHGKVKGDMIECPYHGWQFKGEDGVCTKIPSLGPDAKIPARAKIDSYPVQEKYGLVFAFLGDLPEAERPPIMDLPEYGQDGWRVTTQVYEWTANFQRSVENTLDPAHTEFVHPSMGYQGDNDDYHVPDLTLIEEDWGCGTMTTFNSPDLPDSKMKGLKGEGQMEAGAGNHGPSSAWTKLHFSPFAWAHQYGFSTPVDEKTLKRYFLQARNFRTDPEMDETINERNSAVMMQDKVVIERIEPFYTPQSSTEEVLVKADLVVTRYREYISDWESRGWRIDTAKVEALREEKAFAIPSPARRTAKGWAIEAAPTLLPKTNARAAAE